MPRNVARLSAAPRIRARDGRTLTVVQERELLQADLRESAAKSMSRALFGVELSVRSQRGSHGDGKPFTVVAKGL